MKHFVAVLVCALVAATSIHAETAAETAIKTGQNRISQGHKNCQANPATAVNEKELHEFLEHGGTPPANLGAHELCISKSAGWQNEDGSVNKDVIESRISALFTDAEQRKTLLDKCLAAQTTPEATARQLFRCYKEHVHPIGGHDHTEGHEQHH
ncbi:uncharacterized protein [Euwallacea similis]|uniref:uncharacterized protein n=1 Tax=Euwallacea similis TaxID=1736056 RepID=UPI00344B5680